MSFTQVVELAGETIGLSVTGSSHTAVTIKATNPAANALLIHNTSTSVTVYVNTVNCAPGGSVVTANAATVPGDGTAGSFPVLTYDSGVKIGVRFPLSVTAIGSAAGPTLITVTPIVAV